MKNCINSFGLICAYTPRSQAYIQALKNSGFTPELTILYGANEIDRPGQMKNPLECCHFDDNFNHIFLPNLKIPIEESLKTYGWKYMKVFQPSINSDQLLQLIKNANLDYLIFSGYGGEIVGPNLLSVAPILHSHSGWLPDYRGSTCGYYSLLNEGLLGASVIVLNNKIDEGVILARKKYSPPSNKLALDYLYDSAIRADILVEALDKVLFEKNMQSIVQLDDAGKTYYVIHPLLKHLAILYERN